MRSIAFATTVFLIAASAAHAAPKFVAEWPFRDCRGLICVDVALDGAAPRTLLIDTGNVNSTLMADTAEQLHWKLEPIVRDGKPVADIQRGGAHEVTVGTGKIEAKFLVFNRAMFGKDTPPADGSLAYTFFKDRVLQIDYPHHKLRISDVSVSEANAPGTLQLITFGQKGPPILVGAPFHVNGRSVHAQIDTCFTGTLLVYDAALEKLGLKKEGKPEFFVFTDGGVNMLAASARSLGFGERTLGSKVYFVGAGDNPVHQPDDLFEATVGNALFAHSVVTLDFHAMTLDVQPAG